MPDWFSKSAVVGWELGVLWCRWYALILVKLCVPHCVPVVNCVCTSVVQNQTFRCSYHRPITSELVTCVTLFTQNQSSQNQTFRCSYHRPITSELVTSVTLFTQNQNSQVTDHWYGRFVECIGEFQLLWFKRSNDQTQGMSACDDTTVAVTHDV